MADDRSDFATDRVDASGQPLGHQPLDTGHRGSPEQPPMDDAVPGHDADRPDADADFEQTIEETPTDDLFVQGGA